ncbi:MAG: nicotinate-nucleotide adenylyltransferase [Xanthomonadales bacterium]|nr:nicotinate-nucleotide adenylyltransferase [Xanthomonadales bacterium]
MILVLAPSPLDHSTVASARVLLGGSFDPIHHGHLRAALEAAEALMVARVDLLPAGQPALRSPLAASNHARLAMLQLAVADEARLGVDARELQRPGQTFTIDTLQSLRQEAGPKAPLIFLLGADAFSRLEQWQRWQLLTRTAHLLVLSRPGQTLSPPSHPLFLAQRLSEPLDLLRRPFGHWSALEITPLAISATDLRQRCRQGQSLRYLVPDAVWDYIQAQQLYRATSLSQD